MHFRDRAADWFCALRVLGDGEELESPTILVPRALPPGQLLFARSPRGEAEDDRFSTEQVGS